MYELLLTYCFITKNLRNYAFVCLRGFLLLNIKQKSLDFNQKNLENPKMSNSVKNGKIYSARDGGFGDSAAVSSQLHIILFLISTYQNENLETLL